MRTFKFLGEGRNRIVFRHGSFAIKVPLNWEGAADNRYEAETYRWYRSGGLLGHYARCRLIPGTAILVMELVDLVSRSIEGCDLPEWCDWVDCGQVGLTKYGKLVAYDYGRY